VKPWEYPCLGSKISHPCLISSTRLYKSEFFWFSFPTLQRCSLLHFFIFLSQCLWTTTLVPFARLRIPVPGRPIPHPKNLALLVSCLIKWLANVFSTSFPVLVCLPNFFKFFMVTYLDSFQTSIFIIFFVWSGLHQRSRLLSQLWSSTRRLYLC
jgi:hypothetical protein